MLMYQDILSGADFRPKFNWRFSYLGLVWDLFRSWFIFSAGLVQARVCLINVSCYSGCFRGSFRVPLGLF